MKTNIIPSPKELAHLQIPFEEILKATNNFADVNLIGQGGFGKVYKETLWSGQSTTRKKVHNPEFLIDLTHNNLEL